ADHERETRTPGAASSQRARCCVSAGDALGRRTPETVEGPTGLPDPARGSNTALAFDRLRTRFGEGFSPVNPLPDPQWPAAPTPEDDSATGGQRGSPPFLPLNRAAPMLAITTQARAIHWTTVRNSASSSIAATAATPGSRLIKMPKTPGGIRRRASIS